MTGANSFDPSERRNVALLDESLLPRLAELLVDAPPGHASAELRPGVLQALRDAWEEIVGGDAEAMASHKLDRAESLTWASPRLSFRMERHGATVNGSTRAHLERWTVNVATGVADVSPDGFRQVRPAAKRWGAAEAAALADELVAAIQSGQAHPGLVWSQDGRLRVLTGSLVPGGNRQTVEGRRARFRDALTGRLTAAGWRDVGGGWWAS